MNLSGQLRIILLLIGAVTLWAIYFFGKRRSTEATPRAEVFRPPLLGRRSFLRAKWCRFPQT